MKKLLIILLSIIALLVVAAFVIPIIFKDDIKAAIDKEIEASVNADIVFDVDNLNISLFNNFPSLTVSMNDFGVINRAPFEGHILFAAESFEVEVNLMSVINGDMRLKGLYLNKPDIHIKVLEDGSANYDIAIASEEVEEEIEDTEETATEFSFAIDHWAINNANIIYDDLTLPFLLELKDLTHTGGGDFSQELFDLTTNTTVSSMNVAYDGVEYISNKQLGIDLILEISDDFSKYTFKDNLIKLNDFGFAFDGYVALLEEDINTDITFSSSDNSFKSILSLVPRVFMEGFEAIETTGSFSFGGMAKGTYNDTRMPAFNLNMEIKDAMFKYPDLPTAVTDINVKTVINNEDGNIDNTTVDVSTFHVNMGGNPFDATLKVSELNNVKWDLKVNGDVDLNTVSTMVPMEGTTLAGTIDMNMQTKGQLSALEAEQYDQLPTSGKMKIDGFEYTDETLDYDVTINKADASFSPNQIELSTFDAKIGNSDMQMNGQITNYIGYVLDDKQVLAGKVNFTSTMLDLDELAGEEETIESENIEEDTTDLSVIPIPENIDFVLKSNIKTVKVSDMTLKNASGNIIVKDGIANLSNLTFNTLGGEFVVNGFYNTQDITKPSYDFKLGIKNISISESFKTFTTVQKFAPIAKNVVGDLSTEMGISGLLLQDMMPDLNTVAAEGLLNIAKAALKGSSLTSGLASVTKLKGDNNEITMKDVLMNFTIEDGKLNVQPFDLGVGNYNANVSGTSTLAGDLDYSMKMNIPAGAVGTQINNLLSQYGAGDGSSSTITLPIKIGGTIDDPKYSLGVGEKPKVTDVAKTAITQTTGVDIDAEKEKQREKIMSDAKKQADKVKATAKTQADKVKKEGYAQADKLVTQAGSNIIKKKIAQEAAKKMKTETDKQVNKILQEANQQADKIIKAAEVQAAKV